MSMWSCYYQNICVLSLICKIIQVLETLLCFVSINTVSLEPPQIITASLFENPAVSFFASFVTFCNLDPGIIVPVTSYLGLKYFLS